MTYILFSAWIYEETKNIFWVISANRLLAMTEKITISNMSEVIFFFKIWSSVSLGGQNLPSPDLNGPSFFFQHFHYLLYSFQPFLHKKEIFTKICFLLEIPFGNLLGAIPYHFNQMKWSDSVLQPMKSIFCLLPQNV